MRLSLALVVVGAVSLAHAETPSPAVPVLQSLPVKKKIRKKPALLKAPMPLKATGPQRVEGIDYTEQTSAPPPLTTSGHVGSWVPNAGTYIKGLEAWRKEDGSDNITVIVPISPIPATGQVTRFDGTNWIPYTLTTDDIPGPFLVTIAGAATVEIGFSVVNPSFTATHLAGTPPVNTNPTSATLTDFTPNVDSVSPASATTLTYGTNPAVSRTYTYPGSLNSTRAWIYTATSTLGVTKATANTTLRTWSPRMYFKTLAALGPYDETYIKVTIGGTPSCNGATASTALAATVARTINYAANGYFTYAVPSGLTGPATFLSGGIDAGFNCLFGSSASCLANNPGAGAAISVTNACGTAINYDLWQNTNFQGSAATVVVN